MLKALGGERKWRVFKRGRKEEIENDDGETKKKDRVNGRADKDGCILRLCFSSAVTFVLLFVTCGQTWSGSEYTLEAYSPSKCSLYTYGLHNTNCQSY